MAADGLAQRVVLRQYLPSGDHPEDQALRHVVVAAFQPIELGKYAAARAPGCLYGWRVKAKCARKGLRIARNIH